MRRIAVLICLAVVCCATPAAFAQFALVYNLPPDEIPDPFFNRQIRTPNTQVNVYPTGFIGQDLKIGGTDDFDHVVTNIEVNVLGGFVDSGMQIYPGNRINLYSGTINGRLGVGENAIASIHGGNAGQFITINGTLNMSGGLIEYALFLGGTLNMSGGRIENRLETWTNSVANLTGASVGVNLSIAGTMNLAGGSLGDYCDVQSGGILNILKGSVGAVFEANENSVVNFSGGSIGSDFGAYRQSFVHIYGKSFSIDGLPKNIAFGHSLLVTNRNIALGGTLLDGSTFNFQLNSTYHDGQPYFDPDAAILLTRSIPGDYDQNGVVDGGDYVVWRKSVDGAEGQGIGADGNGDNRIDQVDYALWRSNFGRSIFSSGEAAGTALPEPDAMSLFALFVLAASRFFCRPTTSTLTIAGFDRRTTVRAIGG